VFDAERHGLGRSIARKIGGRLSTAADLTGAIAAAAVAFWLRHRWLTWRWRSMESDDANRQSPANRSDWHDADQEDSSCGEATEFDAAVVIMSAERELMNARIAAATGRYRQCLPATGRCPCRPGARVYTR
jgi:hypothetical protein